MYKIYFLFTLGCVAFKQYCSKSLKKLFFMVFQACIIVLDLYVAKEHLITAFYMFLVAICRIKLVKSVLDRLIYLLTHM